jgi:hypothetical protein
MSLSRDNENLLRQEKRGGKEKEEEKKTNKGRIKEIKKTRRSRETTNREEKHPPSLAPSSSLPLVVTTIAPLSGINPKMSQYLLPSLFFL